MERNDSINWVKSKPVQNEIYLLLNRGDFKRKVADDPSNLCCVIVTSTLCRHSGIRKVPYPKHYSDEERLSENDDNDSGTDEDTEDDVEGHSQNDFLNQIRTNLVLSPRDLYQRRHVRFFHVCACMEEETDIRRLIASSPVFKMTGRAPIEQERKSLHRIAYEQLCDLLRFLEVQSTPCMLFYIRGEKVRYSNNARPTPQTDSGTMKDHVYTGDLLKATGSNYVKWKHVMQNAVVIRNEILKDYDAKMREEAIQYRKETRRKRILERKAGKNIPIDSEEDDNSEYVF